MSELELEPELLEPETPLQRVLSQMLADAVVHAVDLGVVWEKAGALYLYIEDTAQWVPLHPVAAGALRIELDEGKRLRIDGHGKVVRAQ